MKSAVFTAKQRKNLEKLADYLAALPSDYTHFDMRQYFIIDRSSWIDPADVEAETYNICGTVACAVGHGPAAGISANNYNDWNVYTSDKFGVGWRSNNPEIYFTWCFESFWNKHDNTPAGAAARIRYMLDHKDVPLLFRENCQDYAALHREEYEEIKAKYLS